MKYILYRNMDKSDQNEASERDEDSIPLADDDLSAIIDDSSRASDCSKWRKGCESMDSIPSLLSDQILIPGGHSTLIGETASQISEQMSRMCLESDCDDTEDKARLIAQVVKTFGPF